MIFLATFLFFCHLLILVKLKCQIRSKNEKRGLIISRVRGQGHHGCQPVPLPGMPEDKGGKEGNGQIQIYTN